VLSKFPDQCRAKGSGNIIVAKVAELIEQRSKSLFDSGEPPLGQDKISRLLGKWINKIS
jgi:hypothetical protein